MTIDAIWVVRSPADCCAKKGLLTQRIYMEAVLSLWYRPLAACNSRSAGPCDGRAELFPPAHSFAARSPLLLSLEKLAGRASQRLRLFRRPPCMCLALQKTSRTGLLGYSTVKQAQQSVLSTEKCSGTHRHGGAVSPQAASESRTRQADRTSRWWIYDWGARLLSRHHPTPRVPGSRTPFDYHRNPCFEFQVSNAER